MSELLPCPFCGAPGLCRECSADQARKNQESTPSVSPQAPTAAFKAAPSQEGVGQGGTAAGADDERYQGHGVTARDLRRYLEPDGPDVIGTTAVPAPRLSEAVLAIADHLAMDPTEEAQQEAAVLRQAASALDGPTAAGADWVRVQEKAFKRLVQVHRDWCNYCNGSTQVCMECPVGGCSLRDVCVTQHRLAPRPDALSVRASWIEEKCEQCGKTVMLSVVTRPDAGEGLANKLREAITVLDEPFHREAVAAVMEEAARALGREEKA